MSRMTPNEWHDARIARISLIPAPWDAPEPETESPIGRKNDTPQISAIVAKPRPLPSPAKETFCAHDEDALRIAMQRQAERDGQRQAFPPQMQPKPIGNGHPNSLAARIRACIDTHGPSSSQAIAKRLGIRPASARNSLSDQRANGRVTFDHNANLWSLT